MATEKIGIEVEVKGAEKSISSFKDLKTAIKAAKDEQIAMTEKFGSTSSEAINATKKLSGLKDKVEDLNDSTKSLKGSGIEKLTSSFRLLGEGIGTFDFDKVKTGFKGIGTAMSAIPIFLIISGLTLLFQNFDKIKSVVENLIPGFKAVSKFIGGIVNAITDFIGITSDATRAVEALRESADKQLAVNKKYLQEHGDQVNKYTAQKIDAKNRYLEAIKEDGANVAALGKRLNRELANIDNQRLEDSKKVNGKSLDNSKKAAEDKFADEKRLLADIEKAKEESYLRSLKSDEARAVAKAQFDNDRLIEDVNKSKAHQSVKDESLKQISIKLESDLLIIKNDFQGKRDAIEKTTAEKTAAQDKIDYAKKQSDADKAIAIIEEAERKKEQLEDAARERKKAKEKQLQKDIVESVNIAAQTTLSVQKTLSDTYYLKETQKINKLYRDKLKNVVQGSKEEKAILEQKAKEEKDLARQQFETQKKFNRASAILNGILGLGAIFAVPDPTLGILSAIRAVALVATTAANIAAINATQFDEGGASAGGIPAAETSAPTTSQAPSIYGPGQGGQSTTFTGNQNNSFAPVKAYVVETENRSTTNRVNKLVSESTYG